MSTATRPVFPDRNAELPGAVAAKLEVWDDDPTGIGLDADRIAALEAANAAADAALTNLELARQAAEGATFEFNNACRTLRQLTGSAIRTIDAFAIASSDPNAVWTAAKISPPRPRGEAEPPAQPRSFTAGIDGDGNLTIKWKCSNPRGVSGVIYQVSRRLNNTGAFTFLDTVGEKKIVDGTIPPGTRAVTYKVVGKRGQQVGQVSDQFTVQFGMDGDGMNIAESFTGTGQNVGKLAA